MGIVELLCYALQYSTGKGTVNVVPSVMIGLALHLTGGRHRKDFLKKYFFGRIAFYEHGGKTGRAMIKYPLYKKNNSRKITLLYPGLTTVSLDRIITYMKYYYVMCQKGSTMHRCYVQLDPESADILHDSLEQRYDLVQVCDVKPPEVDLDILIK